jgi:hypothetical protein
VASLKDDTLADKLFRFVLGAIGGAGSGWFYAGDSGGSDGAAVATIAVFALIGGLMAMLLGNAFIERVLRRRW